MSRFAFVLFLSVLFCRVSLVSGQVEHKPTFKATETVAVESEPPADVEERRVRFKERNDHAALQDLADELFGMMRLDWRPEGEEAAGHFGNAVEAYRAGRHAEALEAYKLFFMQRVLDGDDKGKDPATRRFVEFFTEAEGLMRGRARIAALTEDYPDSVFQGHNPVDAMLNYYNAGMLDDHHIFLDLGIGEPGEVNWVMDIKGYYGPTWHTARDERFFASSVGYGPDFFGPLLVKYIETGEPAYLGRWAAYVDDYTLNFLKDVQRMPWAEELNWSTFYNSPPLDSLIFTLRARPEAVQLFPAPTLARIVLDTWRTQLPKYLQLSRAGGGNRRIHIYGHNMNLYYAAYPELAERNYLVHQRRRTLEDHTRKGVQPDGTDWEYGLPYYTLYFTMPQRSAKQFEGLPEGAWVTPQWYEEIRRTQELVGSYVMRSLDPIGHQPGNRHALRNIQKTTRTLTELEQNLPDMLARPEHAGHWAWRNGKFEEAHTSPRAYSFPYGGQYFIWSDWSEQPQFMHLTAAPEGARNRWRFNNNIWLAAHGQLMLFFAAEDYVLEVDGVGGMMGGQDRRLAGLTPQAHRFHSSDHFNLMEARLSDDSRVRLDAERGKGRVVDPMSRYPGWSLPDPEEAAQARLGRVDHHRQILFARDAGVWIVTDRVAGEREHDFRFLWPFRGDFGFRVGSLDLRNKVRTPPEDSYLQGYREKQDFEFDEERAIIRTVNPHIPNLSIYHTADHPLRLDPGDFVQHDWRMANALCTGPRIENAQKAVLASALFPRRNLEEELKSFTPVSVAGGTGFDLETEDGQQVWFRAAGAGAVSLVAGPVVVTGETLLLTQKSGDTVWRGMALGVEMIAVHGAPKRAPGANLEFVLDQDGSVTYTLIHTPLEMVTIEPSEDRFYNEVTVTLSHPEPGVEIRYTLDGSRPDMKSPVYSQPITITDSTWITAVAVRPDAKRITELPDSTHSSIAHWAIYEKEPMRKPAFASRPASARQGLNARYIYSDYPLSMFNLTARPVTATGTVSNLFDKALHDPEARPSNFGFIFTGYLEIPEDGVYSLHAEDEWAASVTELWWDLRIWVNGEEWYPATRRQNFGAWTVPLKAGLHQLEVHWVDQRPSVGLRGEAYDTVPQLDISGPDLPRQPIPADWLLRLE